MTSIGFNIGKVVGGVAFYSEANSEQTICSDCVISLQSELWSQLIDPPGLFQQKKVLSQNIRKPFFLHWKLEASRCPVPDP